MGNSNAYAQFTPGLAPNFLNGPLAQAFLTSVGQALDSHVNRTQAGVMERLPNYATPDALVSLGNDRVLPQGPDEPGEEPRVHRASVASRRT